MSREKPKETKNVKENKTSFLVDCSCIVSVLLAALSVCKWTSLKNDLEASLVELNTTGRWEQEALIFNRVPKVGSQTINHLISALRRRNNFTGFTSLDGMPEVSEGETIFLPDVHFRQMAVKALAEQQKPFAFLKHQNFFDFAEFGFRSPIYMNFVRHPVERIISWHYYIRAPWYQFEEVKNRTFWKEDQAVNIEEMKMTLEECLVTGHRGCVLREGATIHGRSMLPSHASQMSFFCGHDKDCDGFNTARLYQKAVENVEKYFAVVGVLEDWDMSLQVLEEYIPRFFAGSREIFSENEEIRHVNKNIYKPKIAPHVKALIAQNLTREIEFYHFCRQRLHKQYLALQT